MAGTPLDSAIYRELFGDPDIAALFSDRAEVRAMLLVEAALAKAQSDNGVIPASAAEAIGSAARRVDIDPATLTGPTAQNGTPVPGLVQAFRDTMDGPSDAQYVHWGATSQDITDTALVLRLKQVTSLFRARLRQVLDDLATMSEKHAEAPITGRTFGQPATPTSLGAIAAAWGRPLLSLANDLVDVEEKLLCVSLSGASGTLSVMGSKGPAIRAAMATELGLNDPGGSWHSDRHGMTGFAAWITQTAAALGKTGEDLALMAQGGVYEVGFSGAGSSSTMPQKSNPIGAVKLVALARHCVALNTSVQGAAIHRQQRDGAALLAEWLSLPQMCLSLGAALKTANDVLASANIDIDRMAANLDPGLGLIHAERLTFALAETMPRPTAQDAVKTLCIEAKETGTSLPDLVVRDYGSNALPDLSIPAILGEAPNEARGFAAAVRQFMDGTSQ